MLPPGEYYSTQGHPLRNSLARQAGIPNYIDLSKPNNVVGLSYENLMRHYQLRGFDTVPKPPKPSSSGLAQIFTIPGHPFIKEVQYHPGGRTHNFVPYYKFTLYDKIKGNEIEIKIPAKINENPQFLPGTVPPNQFYFDKAGNRIKFENGRWDIGK
jgi:filamentous hemagglutinin